MPTRRDPRAACRPNDTPSLHERLIRSLIESDPRMCRNGFWRAHRELTDELGFGLDDFPPDRPFLPDAYLFDRDNQEILLFEVEVSCPLTAQKIAAYGWFWFEWDGEGSTDWLPRLFVVDRYGHRNELNMAELYFADVRDAANRPPVIGPVPFSLRPDLGTQGREP
jgi:hypothetical protein